MKQPPIDPQVLSLLRLNGRLYRPQWHSFDREWYLVACDLEDNQ